jgi:cyclopropane-fatty-acyl-phospholipid synthase
MVDVVIDFALQVKLAALTVPLAIILPGGRRFGAVTPRVTLHVKSNSTLVHLAIGQVGKIAEDYVEGKVDIEGSARDIAAVAAELLQDPTARVSWFQEFLQRCLSRAKHSLAADAKQIQFHYDVSDEFYALFLDPRRVYSCAYFNDYYDRQSLQQAQEAKLDLICRKLRLREGERFLDVGAGWGGLLLHAVERYDVRGTGITLSKNQHAYVIKQIKRRGLQKRARIKLLDYRELPEGFQQFDKIASVGMFEHVGRANLPMYFEKLNRLLKPGGLILNHGITAATPWNKQLGGGVGEFIQRYIFPGGELQHISHVLRVAAESELEVLDVENLRPHYAKTLWAWSDALESRLSEARALVGEKTVRAYRLYLAGSAVNFERGLTSLHQVLAQKPSGDLKEGIMPGAQGSYPFNREYMYEDYL